MTQSSLDYVEFVVRNMAETAVENEKYFTELDGVVGDGDFGISLASGFGAMLEQWDELNRDSAGDFLISCAKIFSRNVGGTSGSIWRAAFRESGKSIGDKDPLSAADVIAMLHSAAAGIMDRGGAELGDKTLLDALVPATDALKESIDNGDAAQQAIANAAAVAREQVEISKAWIAKRGRAAYTGERSMGTYDAGAVAIATMAENLAEAWSDL